MIEVGVELLGDTERGAQEGVLAFFRESSDRYSHRIMGSIGPAAPLGYGHNRVGRGSPHLFRTLQYVACFEFSVGGFKEVLGRLYVFLNQHNADL